MITRPGIAIRRHLEYKADEIREKWRNPIWWWTQVKQYLLYPLHRSAHDDEYLRVLDEDWDTLLVIDACRADLFEEVADLESYDSYERVTSGASKTEEWVFRQFAGVGACSDVVYANGNPTVSAHTPTAFHAYRDVWHDADEELNVALADTVADAARELRADHPRKRLVAHFVQPHYPFVRDPELQFSSADSGLPNVWEALRKGRVDLETVWDGYRRNLEYVLEEIEELVEDLPGRTVITADHGNLIGERLDPLPLREYGHPPGIRHPAVTSVPWAVVDGDSEIDRDSRADMTEHLEALGYR